MTDGTKPFRVAVNTEDRLVVAQSLVARFLMRRLESSDGINELLKLFEGPQQGVARAACATAVLRLGPHN